MLLPLEQRESRVVQPYLCVYAESLTDVEACRLSKEEGNWDEQSRRSGLLTTTYLETYPRALRALIGKCIIHNGIWMAEGCSGSVPIVFPVQEAAPLSTMQQAEARLLCPWILLGIFSLWTLR
jgi:hypothetical protein